MFPARSAIMMHNANSEIRCSHLTLLGYVRLRGVAPAAKEAPVMRRYPDLI